MLVGGIGGNDYNHAFLAGISKDLVQTFVPPVVGRIASAITVSISCQEVHISIIVCVSVDVCDLCGAFRN